MSVAAEQLVEHRSDLSLHFKESASVQDFAAAYASSMTRFPRPNVCAIPLCVSTESSGDALSGS